MYQKQQITKTCPVCGGTFTGSTKQLYCSAQCRIDSWLKPITCERCGSEFVSRTQVVRFCASCKKQYCSEVNIVKGWESVVLKQCQFCGVIFCPSDTRGSRIDTAVFCSRECHHKWQWAASTTTRLCKECGKVYLLHEGVNGNYCSHQCATPKPKRCRYCGKLFQPSGSTAAAKHIHYCSRSCCATALNCKRHALKRTARYEFVSKDEVITRDKGICYICRRPVVLGVSRWHPMSATLDHVIPLSMGGSHTYANIRLAHRRCNCYVKRNSLCYIGM